jgi:hypothetical protein
MDDHPLLTPYLKIVYKEKKFTDTYKPTNEPIIHTLEFTGSLDNIICKVVQSINDKDRKNMANDIFEFCIEFPDLNTEDCRMYITKSYNPFGGFQLKFVKKQEGQNMNVVIVIDENGHVHFPHHGKDEHTSIHIPIHLLMVGDKILEALSR